jgi:Transposase DDE domain
LRGGGFDQCYNAQAVVATESLLIVANDVVQASNDQQQLAPMLTRLKILPQRLGRVRRLLADAGYASEANVEHCEAAKIEPLIALGRERHHAGWRQRFAPAPKVPPKTATPLERMAHRLRTPAGRKLYALRKQTPEPVFGSIKSAMGFRQFLLRGLPNVQGEWNLVTMSWNIKRMFALQSV